MSLLWPERLHAGLAPGKVSLLGVSPGWKSSITVRATAEIASSADQPWKAEVEALRSLLAEHGRKKSCIVALSNHYVRYQPLLATDASMSDAEIQALARHGFIETYGEAANRWLVRISGWRQLAPSPIACAIDEDLLASLHEACRKADSRLTSVVPYLASGYNLFHKRIRGRRACFSQNEQGRLTLALLESGVWKGVRSIVPGASWTDELDVCLKRETLLAGWGNEPFDAYIHLPDLTTALPPKINDQSWHRLTTPAMGRFSSLPSGAFALAASSI